VSLKELRGQLDSIDEALIELLGRRDEVVGEIWAWKQANGVELRDPVREAELRSRLLAHAARLGLSGPAVSSVLETIVGRRLR
jgi:chorismate mutase / prephenate dehydrogenase